jgi:hypothetical protein
MSTTEAEFIQLRAENDALKALLAKHGIAVPQPSKSNIGDAALQPTLRTGCRKQQRFSSSDDSFAGGMILIQFAR